MDFFAQQEAARRKSAQISLLAAVFVLPVVWLTGLTIKFAFSVAWYFVIQDGYYRLNSTFGEFFSEGWVGEPIAELAFWGTATLLVLAGGFAAHARTASGRSVMRMVGARAAVRDQELVYIDVAEEVALASGLQVPSLWVMGDARDINAFAAGHTIEDAAICVTEGALRNLKRDELQGIVAHEFGHILNGDMRVNTRLTALVEGLGAISTTGKTMLRPFSALFISDDEERGYRFRIGRGGKGGGGLVALILIYIALGFILWLIGLVGVFFARILQNMVSREREFLADAVAVQFTRNPEGLADALRFTRLMPRYSLSYGTSSLSNVAHMFFIAEPFSRLQSHPPIAERVRRLSPRGLAANDGHFRERLNRIKAEHERRVRENQEAYTRQKIMKAALNPRVAVLPPELWRRIRTIDGAGEILVALLKGEQIPEWPGVMTPALKRQLVVKAVLSISQWGSRDDCVTWADRIERLTEECVEMGSFEFMVSCSIRRRLRGLPPAPFRPANQLTTEAAAVVSTVASFGVNAPHAYELAGGRLRTFFHTWPSMPPPHTSVRRLRESLDALRSLMPMVKREFLWSIRTVIAEDGEVTDDEANYLSAVAEAIDANGWISQPQS